MWKEKKLKMTCGTVWLKILIQYFVPTMVVIVPKKKGIKNPHGEPPS